MKSLKVWPIIGVLVVVGLTGCVGKAKGGDKVAQAETAKRCVEAAGLGTERDSVPPDRSGNDWEVLKAFAKDDGYLVAEVRFYSFDDAAEDADEDAEVDLRRERRGQALLYILNDDANLAVVRRCVDRALAEHTT